MTKPVNITVLGAGNMGTAIAKVIGENGHPVKLWNYEGDTEPLEQIVSTRENKKYLPGIVIPSTVTPTTDLKEAVAKADIVVMAIPSCFVVGIAKRIAKDIKTGAICLDFSKGLEDKTLCLMHRSLEKIFTKRSRIEIVSLSGPAIATEIARGGLTAMNLTGSPRAVKKTLSILQNNYIKLFPTTDKVGLELSGAFKNVYAIALGLSDGLGWPMNTKAALLVFALQELGLLVKKMGGKSETVFGLAGLGDLTTTAMSPHSRNRRYGEYLASGLSSEAAKAKVGQVVEGISAVECILQLAKKKRVKLPLATAVGQVIAGANAEEVLKKYIKNK